MVIVASFAFVKEQVTFSPPAIVIATEPPATSGVPPALHVISVKRHPAIGVSVTVYTSGSNAVTVLTFENAGSASSSSVNPPSEPVNAKSCPSFGTASLMIVIDPWSTVRSVFVNVHVTSAPATRSTSATPWTRSTVAPGVHVMPVRSQFGVPSTSPTKY